MSSKAQKGIKLLKNGSSYNQIRKTLGVSKGTINYWFKQLNNEDKNKVQAYRFKNWKKSYHKYVQKKKKKTVKKEKFIQDKAAKEIKNLSRKELFLIGIALYWAEGYKKNRWGLQFSNSDVKMISLMMKFFREICKVPEKKFYMQMILHENIDEEKSLNYWSKATQVDKSQFKKPFFSKSKSSRGLRKKHQLPYGTLQIRIHDKKLTHKIYGYIKGLKMRV